MTKRLSSKLLSVILALAICATTVFGCLMTVSAADEAVLLTFDAGISTNAELTKATIPLTITLVDDTDFVVVEGGKTVGGIVAGQVALSYDDSLTLTGITAKGGTKVDNQNTLATDVELEETSDGFIFNTANADNVYYKDLTFTLSFDLKSPAKNGDKLNVTATSASVADVFGEDPYEIAAATGSIVMGCDHKIEPVGDPIKEDAVNGYAIYSESECELCHATFGMQVVPTKLSGVVDTLVFDDAYVSNGSESKYYDSVLIDSTDGSETGADWEHAIIIDSAEELAYLTQYAPTTATRDKYYKVADGIAGFDMSGGKIDLDGTLEENLTAITTSGKNHSISGKDKAFAGNFDGNGATVYGLWHNEAQNPAFAGLFPLATGNVTIKNVNVSLSHLKATQYAGGIVGAYYLTDSNNFTITNNKLTVECCSVTESHIETTGVGSGDYGIKGAGAIYGIARNYKGDFTGSVIVNNCFINLDAKHLVTAAVDSVSDENTDSSIHGGIGAVAVTGGARFNNCVVIGITPYSTFNSGWHGNAVQHTGPAEKYTNIYTDAVVGSSVDIGFNDRLQNYTKCMTQLTTAEMKGEAAKTNMPALFDEESDVWAVDVNRGYPTFKQSANPDSVNTTSDYGLTLLGTNNEYKNDGTYNFNFYYRPDDEYTNADIDLYVAQLSEDGKSLGSFRILKGEVLSEDEAKAISGLQSGDIRYTIEKLSAREIHNSLLATAVAVKDGKAVWGETAEISIAKYAKNIIDGDYAEADKNLAEAVLKYGEAAALALNTKNDSNTGTTVYWNGNTDSNLTDEVHAYSTQDGSASNPIIIDSAEELAYLVQMPYADTQGKYYKIADGISNIVLQKEEHDNGIMQLSSSRKVKEYFEKNSKTSWVDNYHYSTRTEKAFYGNFDGNGVNIYGLYAASGQNSLFGGVMAPAVVKNFTVRNSYMYGSYGAFVASGVVLVAETDDEKNKNNFITFESIEISNCHMDSSAVGNNNTALLYGEYTSGANVTVNNLLVYGCEILSTADNTVHTRLSGQTGWNNPATGIKNSVLLDCSVTLPQTSGLYNYSRSTQVVENVYSSYEADHTNNSKITYITNEQAMGVAAVTNMPGLDWESTWCFGSTYPSLAKGSYSSSSSTGKTIYWSGNKAAKFYTEDDGRSADNPIIISTAEELAYVLSTPYADNDGQYFRIADGIDKIVLQPEAVGEGIVSLNSSDDVKDYFKNIIDNKQASTLRTWVCNTWNEANISFGGHFDGNGVEIYGMYASDSSITNSGATTNMAGGLFNTVDGGSISNLALKNSYVNLGSGSENWQFGLLIAYGKTTNSTGDGRVIYIDRCTIANNYAYKQVNDNNYNGFWSGAICGMSPFAYIMQNCFIYGNDIKCYSPTLSKEFYPALYSTGTNNFPVTGSSIVAEHPDWFTDNAAQFKCMVENSVIMGTPLVYCDLNGNLLRDQYRVLSSTADHSSFKNVYTDWDITKINDEGKTYFSTEAFTQEPTYTEKNWGWTVRAKIINENDLIGNNAADIVNAFNTSNGKTVWYTGNGTYLGFDEPTDMLPGAQAIYDAITFKTADDYGENNKTFGVYATSLNLKTNPYISFAFAFSGEYKSNRDKIEVTFTYNGGSKKVSVADANGLLDGWSNASNDRFHIYRFEDIPVEALCKPITVTVSYNGTEKVTTGTFSVEGFGVELVNAYKKTPCNYYATRIEAVKALLFYTQMLQARYGAQA